MATEDEAREAADGEEVQVETADLGTTHLQINLEGKLSSREEIKDEAKIMDSTEGLLKVTEDQVLEKAPYVAGISPEYTPNGTAPSLNSHMKEAEISNEKPQENGQKENEQVEVSTDGVSTDQSNKSNGEEVVGFFGHVESTKEDTSLLKHENEETKEQYQEDAEGAAVDNKMVHKDTLQTDEATIDAQQGQNLEPAEVTEDTQHASTSCPHDKVAAKASAGVQTSLEPKVNGSDALPDTSDGNTETEPAELDKESFPADGDIAEHTNEIIKLEDQPSKQTDDVDAEVVQEDVPKSKQTDVPEDLTKTEQADESTNGDQEELNQELPEESSDPVRESTEETSNESNVSASEETAPKHDGTTREPALDVQEVQNKGLAEEIEDAKEVDTEKTVQQSGAAFEEATQEDIVATIEPSSDIQHLNNVESEETKGLENAKAEETSIESNMTVAEDAGQDKKATEDIQPVQGLEEEPKSTETVEMDGVSSQASQQSHVAASEELATEDNSMAVESRSDDIQQTLEQGSVEVKDTEASEIQEICHERTISASEEDSVEDDVTAEGLTSDAQEVENVESAEEIKDNTADNIVGASNVATVKEADQENNVLTSEDASEQQTRGLEPEQIQNTEPVETEEASNQRHPALLNAYDPEDTTPSENLKTESTAEIKETEATKTEALPQERNVSSLEKPVSRENITASKITSDAQEVENSKQPEDAEGNQDTGTKEISDQSNDVFAREEAQVTSDLASEPTVDMQSVQELQSEKEKNVGLTEVNEASGQMDAIVLENPTHEDSSTTRESLVMEAREVSSSGATEGQEMPQHEVTQSEDHEKEENTTAIEPKILAPEPAEEMGDGEATEPRSISKQSTISSSEESGPAEDVTAKEPDSDIKEVQTEEPELTKEQNDVKTGEISNQSIGTIVGETAQENLETATAANETEDVKSTHAIAEEETPDEHVQEFEAPIDIPPVEEPELEETKTTDEPVEVHDNVTTNDLPVEEIAEIHNESGDLTEDVKSNAVLSDEAAPDEDAKATEETADIPQPQDPEIEEIKNNEPVELEDYIIARDLPEEEIKDTEAMETEVVPDESTSANITQVSNDVKSNVALAEEAVPEEHVTETEATIDMPRAQEPELEEIKNTELLEVEESISATDKSAGEIKTTEAMETEAINESTDANSSEITEDVKRNIAPEDKAAQEEHVISAGTTVHIPRAQEPELEEIKNTEPVEVKENIPASDLPAEEVNETDATETEVISESTDANISEPTEDAQRNVALADEAASEDHVIATEATLDISPAQEPGLELIENAEHVEVEENISANVLPAEENLTENEQQMTGIEPTRPEPTPHESNVANLEEMATEDNKTILTDVTIQQLQEQEPVEFRDTEGAEPQGISPSHIASTSEESAPEDNVATEPSPDTQAENLESLVTEETEDVERSGTIAEEETQEEHVQEFEEPVDMPPVKEPELEETKNTEPVEAHDNVTTNDLPAEEVKNTEAIEIAEIHNESGDLTEDVKSNVALADEAAPDKYEKPTEATADIAQEEEPELEEITNSVPVEVEDNIIASDVPEEEIKETEAMETEMIPDETSEANSSDLTDEVKSNVALAEEAASEEHVIETEAAVDIPRSQEPELEEIKNTEPVEVEENISATDQSAEEMRITEAIETEALNESIYANSSKLTEDVKGNFALEDEAAHEEHAMAAETTVHIPRAQEPELEEIKNTEPVEVKEDVSASDLPAEVVKETEATETEEISESTDANTSELTEDAETNVDLIDEAAPEEHVVATEVTVDIPRAQEPELEEIENAEHVEVEENISANDLPAEEVKDTDTMETEAINDGNITELTEVALADEAVPDIHVDIPQAQEPAVEEINNTEPVEAEDIITADDVPAEKLIDTEDMETEEIRHESTDDSLTASEPLADIQQLQEQEAVEDEKCTDTTENQGGPQQSIVSTADELTPTEEETAVTEPTRDTHVQNVTSAPTEEEIENSEPVKNQEFSDRSIFSSAEVAAQESPLLEGEVTSNVQEVLKRDSTEETREIEAVLTEEDQQHRVSNLEKPVSENNVSESEKTVADKEVQEDKTVMGTEEISIQDNIPITENAAQESSEPGSGPNLLVQSEDSKDQLVKEEERGPSNGPTLEDPTAEDNDANEIDSLTDTKQEHGLESEEGNKGIDSTEGEEASHPSQDAGLEKLVSESNVATIEPTSDIPQVNDLDDAEETMATEAINDENISCKKTEVATLEDPSPTDDGTSPKENSVDVEEETLGNEISNAEPKEQKDESSDLGEKTALTTQEGESPTEEDVVHISGEDTVETSNNTEQIKEQSKAAIEHDAIKSGDHTNGQDDEQLHNVELQMQVCERSVDVSAIEQPDEDAQKVNLDRQKEDEVIDKQTEELQRDGQKQDDSSTDLTTETLLKPQSSAIGTANLNEGIDVFEAEQTETVATEMLMNEQTLHIPQGSISNNADLKVENSTEIEETPEQENTPNITETLYDDAEDEKESTAKPSTEEQVGTIDETTNEEVGNGLASPIEKDLQQTSNPAPSNEEALQNNPTVVPQNVERGVHREEEECINRVNDDMQAIQASDEEIVDEVEKKQEMQNEDTNVNNDEIQTKPVDEESSELHSNDSTDTKMDDTMTPYAEIVHGRIDARPREIEEVEGNKGFSSISEYVVANSKENDVEQDLGIHAKVVDEILATGEQNGEEVETNSNEEMAASYTAVTEAVKFREAIDDKASGADGALSDENLETFEDNRMNHEASSVVTASGESMNKDKEHLSHPAYSAVDGNTTEQASGSEVTEIGLLFPENQLPTESEEHEESQTTKEQDEEDIHEQETGDMEKEEKEDEQSDLPVSNFLMNLIMGKESTEPDGNSEIEADKKQEETTKNDSCLITSQQEESFVPTPEENKVDNKLISEQGKDNLEGSEETHDFKLESDEELSRNAQNLEACQNNVQGEISSELVPGGPGLMTEVEPGDVKLGEKATNSEEGSLKGNLDDSTNPKASQEDTIEEGRTDLRHESLPEDTSSDAMARQTPSLTEPDPSGEKKLPNETDDLQSPLSSKREESTKSSIIEAERTIEAELENEVEKEEEKQHTTNTGRATEGQIEKLDDNSHEGTEAISDEQTAEITEPVMGTKVNLVHEKEISAGSECEEEKQSSKLSNSELYNSEKALDIQSDGSSLHINQDKQDEFAGDLVMEKNNVLDKPGESNLHEEQDTEIGQESPKESSGGDKNCLAIREPVMKEENANRSVESHVQSVNTKSSEEQETFMSQVQERGLDVVSAKEAPEAEENVVEMAKPEFSTDEEQRPEEDKSNMAGDKTKEEEEAKSFLDEATTKTEGAVQEVSHNQSRDLNVVFPTEAPGSEESCVDIKTPEFSTDEEQSPKKDESNMAEEKSHDEKTNGDEEAKNFTDEAPMKIEQREAGQKASPKKHNILSGVGSKVKHQLAKVKKAIIGKPGHTKSELPKS